ncbi:MAG: LPP20 family lipoprotein [Sulfurimonas sp.]|jgi:hypothetical protein
MLKLKEVLSLTVSGLLLAAIAGCSNAKVATKEVGDCMQDGASAPSWVCKPQVQDAYVGIGIAEKNEANPAQMKETALKSGYAELAKQMQVQVKEKLDNYIRTTGTSDKEAINNLYTSISKQVATSDFNLAKDIKTWTAPSGKLYWLLVSPKANFDADLKNAVKLSYLNDKVTWLGFKSKQSVANLEKEFGVTLPKDQTTKVAQGFQVETINDLVVGRNKKK